MLTCRFLDRNPEPLRTPLPVSASFSVRMAPGRSCRADRPGTAVPAEGGDPCFWLCSGERLALGAPGGGMWPLWSQEVRLWEWGVQGWT